jgi:hypothetical protein
MARLASALYRQGRGPRDVIRECYGVAFPDEFFVTAREWHVTPRLMVRFTDLPWELSRPPGEGGVSSSPTTLIPDAERKVLARDADLVPLMQLIGDFTSLSQAVICYRMSELRAARTAVFATMATPEWDGPIDRCGDSLLGVLHAHHVDYLQRMEWALDQPWNVGFGALPPRTVDYARMLLGRVEALQRQASSGGG